jgi:hypothetical protein
VAVEEITQQQEVLQRRHRETVVAQGQQDLAHLEQAVEEVQMLTEVMELQLLAVMVEQVNHPL